MKTFYVFSFFTLYILATFICPSCMMKHDPEIPSSDIVYEIFIQSFCDSNGDGIGDLPGLISKLDYIQELGATAIWIMPVHPSPSYHKYDVSDYYAIHPDYGTMADMDRLIDELHKRKMKLILDLVINHTSSEHPWFKEASSSPDNQYRQYYVWRDFETVKDEIEKKTTTFDSDNLTQWHTWPNDNDRYYGFFWKGMPDLNFDYAPLREDVYKIGKFWLEKGIDGFRLDAAKHIYPDDRLEDTKKFWEEFTAKMRAISPDVKIIGEVWSDPHTLSTLFKGLPSLFNFELTKTIPESILAGDASTLINSYIKIRESYQATKVPFEDAILLSNHDMNRIRSTLGSDIAKSKLAASILLTLPGTPYVYYGEEIGMMGVKPDIHIREPFLWGDPACSDTSWQIPQYSVEPEVIPLQVQKENQVSIYNHYKKWIGLRKKYPDLATGNPEFKNMQNNAIMAYTISGSSGTLWVIHNLGSVQVSLPFKDKANVVSDPQRVDVDDELVLPGYGSALIHMK